MNTVLISLLLVAAVAKRRFTGEACCCGVQATGPSRKTSARTFASAARSCGRRTKVANDTVDGGIKSFTEIGKTLDSRVKDLQEGTEAKLEATRGVLDRIRDTVDGKLDTVRGDLTAGLKTHSEALVASLDRTGTTQVERLDAMNQAGSRKPRRATRACSRRIRSTFDTRVEELRQSLDARVKEMQDGQRAQVGRDAANGG